MNTNFKELLQFMVKEEISDIHFKANTAPLIRLHGQLISTGKEPMAAETISQIVCGLLGDSHKKRFEQEGELDMSYAIDRVSRFRVNIYRQKGTLALSLRVIPLEVKSFQELNLPVTTMDRLCASPSGLILVAGVTGAGKTTTLNAMVNYLNETWSYNIITVEDPIEFFHKDKKSSISQREVGSDTQSFNNALKHILRQDPDVIVIGEMRDPETVSAAVTAAETGHVVLSTIHTMDAPQTVQRIVDSLPALQPAQVRVSVANVLRGVIAQKLIPGANQPGRIPCTEIMVMTPYLRQLITEGKLADLYVAMGRGQNEGMWTFDQDLHRLFREGKITKEVALAHSTRPENLTSLMQGISVRV